ncbi:MAG: cobyric acid synthase [Nitrospirae bacterium]|nr:cobyric acid synthase [Nitrospirota bacterium]
MRKRHRISRKFPGCKGIELHVRAKTLMIQGTGSGAGKSLLVMALCRILSDDGINVAPFKSQNMALNSFVTREGGEIGRAQALQAEAARVEPSVYMNPVLLKASGEAGSQVILLGLAHSHMSARQYYAFKEKAWEVVVQAFEHIASKHDVIIIEGAGSPAEINLSDVEIVNMAVARHTNAPVLLVGDIDRGGVFASLYGTVALLGKDAVCIKGFVINKFRGDATLLTPGIDMLREKTGIDVVGVLPFIKDLILSEEDGLNVGRTHAVRSAGLPDSVKVSVVRLNFISNFTDFDPFYYEPDVEIDFTLSRETLLNSDLIIIPGTKNTIKDLLFLRASGLEDTIREAAHKGTHVMGMCGGYQMLGRTIRDPFHVESEVGEVEGMSLLDVETIFDMVKSTRQVRGSVKKAPPPLASYNGELKGYEIHMGRSMGDVGLFDLQPEGKGTILTEEAVTRCTTGARGTTDITNSTNEHFIDGSSKGRVWGTYVHGIFDDDSFRRALLNGLREVRGLSALPVSVDYHRKRDAAIDAVAAIVREHLDMETVYRLLGV